MDYIDKVRIPEKGADIYKDECIYSYDSPYYAQGLYVCMQKHIALGRQHIERYTRTTGNNVFLFFRNKRLKMPADANKEKVSKLAIGIDGGFSGKDDSIVTLEDIYVVVMPEFKRLEIDKLPEKLATVAKAIIESVSVLKTVEATDLKWDGELLQISRFAQSLEQLPTSKRIPPSGWKCDKCDKCDNLWLNLTDGSILCGRKFFDGSGGNNHAVEHYADVKYPLAVKLGTITEKGADVYSYAEDDMVLNPYLKKHLAHFGISPAEWEKTEKTMNELEILANEKYGEWSLMQESGELKNAYGPGLTGMLNLGNSCYMNSLMQILFNIPDFRKEYYDNYQNIINANNYSGGLYNFDLQMSKLAYGLLSGRYSVEPEPPIKTDGPVEIFQNGIKPLEFKNFIGKGHAEFSTKRQQDVQEFLLHIIDKIKKSSKGKTAPTESMRFEVEERIQCTSSSKVRYTKREEFMLSLSVPLEECVNKDEYNNYMKSKEEGDKKVCESDSEVIRQHIPLTAMFQALSKVELVEDFYSSAIKAKTTARKSIRLTSFPDYLFLHIKKFTFDKNWQPVKLDIAIDILDEIDLADLRGHGMAADEVELDDESEPLSFNAEQISQLMNMGFGEWACKRALLANRNAAGVSNVEVALNWIMEHMDDADLNSPIVEEKKKKMDTSASNVQVTEGNIDAVQMMGFTREQCIKALTATDNSVERAVEWIFSHPDELDSSTPSAGGTTTTTKVNTFRDGSTKYKLAAFICHMGKSTGCGHYVAHIKREGQWFIFNDEKVAYSEKPPKELAYIYVYKRI